MPMLRLQTHGVNIAPAFPMDLGTGDIPDYLGATNQIDRELHISCRV